MGLDMYAYRVANPEEPSPIHLIIEADYEPFDGADVEQIHYWRKHPNLHGWMQDLYYRKGGLADSFNCVNVVLTAHDLDALEKDIQNRDLPQTGGFFFGESTDDRVDEDLEFIKNARAEIAAGNVVYYTSWW